jgi:hypothetical protein
MASRTKNRVRMRCGVTACRTRFTLRRDPALYVRPIKCPRCGDSLRVRNVEAERRRELAKQATCNCGGYPFPHRQGSMRGCAFHPRADQEMTEVEAWEYHYVWRTPRGG